MGPLGRRWARSFLRGGLALTSARDCGNRSHLCGPGAPPDKAPAGWADLDQESPCVCRGRGRPASGSLSPNPCSMEHAPRLLVPRSPRAGWHPAPVQNWRLRPALGRVGCHLVGRKSPKPHTPNMTRRPHIVAPLTKPEKKDLTRRAGPGPLKSNQERAESRPSHKICDYDQH